MFRRLTSRRTLKWTGTIGCATFLAIMTTSYWWRADFTLCWPSWTATVYHGGLAIYWGFGGLARWDPPPCRSGICYAPQGPLAWHSFEVAPTFGSVSELDSNFSDGSGIISHSWFRLPFALPLAVAMTFTALVWRLDRRRPLPGHCRNCNYNLTANTSGVCPECGTPTGA